MTTAPNTLRASTPGDDTKLRAFLEAANLPAADVETGRQEYLLLEEGERLVGSVGLEVVGQDALVRSLAVASDRRGRGLAALLHDGALELARARSVKSLYLLTATAQDYAARKGFERVSRESVPPGILALPQFRALCPATAACMRLSLA